MLEEAVLPAPLPPDAVLAPDPPEEAELALLAPEPLPLPLDAELAPDPPPEPDPLDDALPEPPAPLDPAPPDPPSNPSPKDVET